MSKSRKNHKTKIDAAWEALPECDRRFMSALCALLDVFGDGAFCFRELPEQTVRMLHEADRDTRFNVIVECLGLLLDAPIYERLKRGCRDQEETRKGSTQIRRAGAHHNHNHEHLHRRMRSR